MLFYNCIFILFIYYLLLFIHIIIYPYYYLLLLSFFYCYFNYNYYYSICIIYLLFYFLKIYRSTKSTLNNVRIFVFLIIYFNKNNITFDIYIIEN